MNYYYIDIEKQAIKMTLEPENIPKEIIFNNIIFDNFKKVKDFFDIIYSDSKYKNYNLNQQLNSLNQLILAKQELTQLEDYFLPFKEELNKYNIAIDVLEKELEEREKIFSKYKHIASERQFVIQEFRDYSSKNILVLSNYAKRRKLGNNYVKFNKAEQEQLAKVLNEKNITNKGELVKSYINTLNDSISEYSFKYADFHNKHKLEPLRKNEIKNIFIIYLVTKKELNKQIYLTELEIKAKSDFNNIRLVKTEDIKLNDIKINSDNEYNIYQVCDDKINEIYFIGDAYNRVGMLNSNGDLTRNDIFIIDDNFQGNQITLNKQSFYDKDEVIYNDTGYNDMLDSFWEQFYGKQLFNIDTKYKNIGDLGRTIPFQKKDG